MARLVREVTQDFRVDLGHPRGYGSLVGQAHGGHEPLCDPCQMGYYPAKGFDAGMPY